MAFEMPSMPPELAALFAARAAKAASPAAAPLNNSTAVQSTPGTPPAALGAAAPMRNVFGMPEGAGIFQRPQTPIAPPSDDPAISGEPTLPGLPDTSAISNEQKKVTDLESRIANTAKPQPQDYRPSLLRRILSVPLAAAAGLKNPEAGAMASQGILGAPYRRAESKYEAQISPLQRQLEYENKVNVPLAESEARTAQTGFENQMQIAKEKREQTAAENETGDKVFQETGADGKVKYYQTTKSGVKREVPEPREQAEDRRRREEDDSTPAPGARPEPDPAKKGAWRVQTKGGGYMPYEPKSIDEGAMLGDERATGLFKYEHRKEGDTKNNADQNGYTPGEQREITQRTRPMQTRVNQLERTRSLLVGSTDKEDQAQLKALDAEIADQHQQMDAIENEVMGRRQKGGAGKGAAPAQGGNGASALLKVPAGAPSAKDKPDGAKLKSGGKVIGVARGGQWYEPSKEETK